MPLTPEVHPDHEAMSRAAAALLAERLRANPGLLLCAATGGSPARAYDLLAERRAAEPGLFDAVRVLKLDEWGGLPMTHPGTCEAFLQRHLTGPLGLPPERYFAFESDPADPEAECARVRAVLEGQGRIDLCVLGLGLNGHLALNEPGLELRPHAHVARLTAETLRHPMIRGAEGRVSYGLTLGMADLLRSREVLLLVSGPAKREPLRRLLSGPLSTEFPASFLWLHPALTLLCDEAAYPS